MRITLAALEVMREQGHGLIVTITSAAASLPLLSMDAERAARRAG